MPIDFDKASRERDRVLRRSILESLYLSRGTAPMLGMSGRSLMRSVNASVVMDERITGDDHAMGLFTDLVVKHLAEVTRGDRGKGTRVGPDVVFLRITDKGCKLYRSEIEADPDVWDPRATGEEL